MILYDGPSLLDGAPIVAIATGVQRPSSNPKTGPMLQTWILRADTHPTEALRTGNDASICGTCPLRGAKDEPRVCYVNMMGPNAVWRAYREGKYPQATDLAAVGANRFVRLGAYGDPAAVPTRVWHTLVSQARGHTGYTHAWEMCDDRLKTLCMASVESPEAQRRAWAAGWRTFRVRRHDEPRWPDEAQCPASAEAGHKLQCHQCLACDGTASGRRGNIAIVVHGRPHAVRHFEGTAA